jgi:hypothetical protein
MAIQWPKSASWCVRIHTIPTSLTTSATSARQIAPHASIPNSASPALPTITFTPEPASKAAPPSPSSPTPTPTEYAGRPTNALKAFTL